MLETHKQRLQSHNLSITAARLAVLWAVETCPHSDAETIWKQACKKAASLSKQSVYDNLHVLTEKGIIRMIQPMGHTAKYEPQKGDNHHHLVCRSCGKTTDVPCAAAKAPCIHLKHDHGFALDEAEVIFWGTCPTCQKTKTHKGATKHG